MAATGDAGDDGAAVPGTTVGIVSGGAVRVRRCRTSAIEGQIFGHGIGWSWGAAVHQAARRSQ